MNPRARTIHSFSRDGFLKVQDEESADRSTCSRTSGVYDEDEEEHSWRQQFLAGTSEQFRLASGLAFRVAAWTTIYTSIVLVFRRYRFADAGFPASSILCNMLFTVGASIGSTIANVFYGAIGIFWAWIVFWLLLGFFPNGFTGENGYVWWIGVLVTFAYTMAFLVLNVNANIRFWALVNFTGGFAMQFLNPTTSTADYSVGFELNYKGAAENAAILFFMGAALACSIFVVPPYTALGNAQRQTCDVVDRFCDLQQRILDYYCGTCQTLRIQNMKDDLADLKERLDLAMTYDDASWYESLGKSRARALTVKLAEVLSNAMDCFEPVFRIACDEDFGETHTITVRCIMEPLQVTLKETSALLKLMHVASIDGDLDAEEKHALEAHIRSIPVAVDAVQRHMQQASAQFGREPINQSVLGEHHFVYTFCTVSQIVLNAGRSLLNHGGDEDSWSDMFLSSIKRAFDISKDDLKWSIRSAIPIFLNFTIGYLGVCDDEDIEKWNAAMADPEAASALVGVSQPTCFINRYTSGLVSINIILLSKLSGSTFKSGLDRVGNVVLATVVGQIGFVFLGWCTDFHRVLTAISVFVSTQGFMYVMYLNGPNSSLGQRLAAMTVSSLLALCTDSANTLATYSGTYHALSEIILGVIVMMLVDMVFGDKPSSVKATETQLNAISEFSELLKQGMDNRISDKELLSSLDTLKGTLSTAKNQGSDAVNEPALWRQDWNQPFFSKLEWCVFAAVYAFGALLEGSRR